VKVGFLGYLVTSLFLHGAYGYMFWLQVGMAVALVVIAQREAAERPTLPVQVAPR
jgi:hypothetical protein